MNATTQSGPGYMPAVEGIQFRHPGQEPDYAELAQLVSETYRADGILHTVSAAELENYDRNLADYDPERDSLVAYADGRLVGENYVHQSREYQGPYVYGHHPIVRREWRPALLEHLVEWGERHILELERATPQTGQRIARTFLSKGETELRMEVERRGYGIERYFFSMVRPHMNELPETSIPEGLEIRPVGPEDLRTVWRANWEGFQEHWGHREATEQGFERFRTDPLQDPALWKVAWDGDRVAGMVLNFIDHDENRRLNRLRGYTEDIAVLPPYRRKGLATHLIAESIRTLKRAGMQEASLGVDVDNASGALGLYERLGYKKERESCAYSLSLEDLLARAS